MSLRSRLVVAAAYLLIVMAMTLAIPLGLNIERRASSEFESGVLSDAAILASRISDVVTRSNVLAGTPRLLNDLERIVAGTGADTGARVVVTDGRGRVVADSFGLAELGTRYETQERPEFSVSLFEGRIDSRHRFSSTLGEELLLVTVPVVDQGRVVGAARVSQETSRVQDRIHRSWIGLGLVAAAVVVAGVSVAWFLATSLVRPVRRLEGAARRLGAGQLDARADPDGPPEVATLARSFNQMAEALSANLEAQRDFVANASHQLRTPLTGLYLRIETMREEGGMVGEQAQKAERELDRLSGLVDDLLALASALSMDSTGTYVDLGAAAEQAVERWTSPASEEGKHIKLEARSPSGVWANSTDIAHILDNLIENAIRYCLPGTHITVSTGQADGRATLAVADSGPGIPEQDQPRLFERFYRGSSGRQAGPGTGLGLAIVAELARRWGGEVRLLDGPGTHIGVSLPSRSAVS